MSVQQMTTVFACLTVVAAVLWIAAAGASIFGRSSASVQDFRVVNAPSVLVMAALIPLTAMLGSLYYSEVANFTPCRYCWFQRVFMYSTAVILVIAAARKDMSIKPHAMALTGIGAMIGLYHVLLERDVITESSSCDPNNPCTLDWLQHKWGGWITIPSMSFVGFCATFALLSLLPGRRRLERHDLEQQELEQPEVDSLDMMEEV